MMMKEIFIVALGAIRANKLRSFLTTLGIIIGVGAVITMVALGEGTQRSVESQIERMGTNTLTIRPEQARMGGVATGEAQRLSVTDAVALRDRTTGGLKVAPEITQRLQIGYSRWNTSQEVMGTWPSYFEVNNHGIAFGRAFDEREVQGRRRVAVLGSEVPGRLQTPGPLLIGRTIQIRGIPFEVIGVLEEKGSMGWGNNPDAMLYIPVSTAQYRVMGGRDRLRAILVQVDGPEAMDHAFGEIDRVLRREHRIQPGAAADFSIRNASDLLASRQETSRTFTFLVAGIAAVSLLVGGIGIMNIMLVSVTERTREIGVRKALGATRMNILLQFMVEALVLCFLGGVLGVGAGFGGAALLSHFQGWETIVAPGVVILALAFSAGIGVFFGIWPAQRAAKLDPIDSLRYE